MAMPINVNPNDAPTWHCYEKAYVTHPDWDDVMYDHYEQFMESVIPEVISKELAKVPADEKENRRAELQALKREWFDLERRKLCGVHRRRAQAYAGPPRVGPPRETCGVRRPHL